jgi:hypothetical protein
MDFKDITSELKKSVGKLKNKEDKEFTKKMGVVELIPSW